MKVSEKKRVLRISQKDKKYVSYYGIFCIDKGVLLGLIERSFSMDWVRDYVKIYTDDQNGKYPLRIKPGQFVVRLSRRNPKIRINGKVYNIKLKHQCVDKFTRRNAEFYLELEK